MSRITINRSRSDRRAAALLVAPAASAMAQPPAAAAAPAPPPPDWTGNVNFGLALTPGNTDTVNLNGGFEVKYDPKTHNVFKSSGLFLYGETKGEKTAEQYALTFRDEYALNARAFVFGDFRYLHDRFKGISYLVSPTGGIGFKLVDLPATTLAVWPGGGGVWEKDYGFDTTSSAALTFDEKFTHKLTATATVGQTFLALWKTNDFETRSTRSAPTSRWPSTSGRSSRSSCWTLTRTSRRTSR